MNPAAVTRPGAHAFSAPSRSISASNVAVQPAAPAIVPNIDPRTYETIAAFLKRSSGFALSEDKKYLIGTRLQSVAAIFKLASVADLAQAIESGGRSDIERAVTEAMTTNETLFFRDGKPFEALRTKLIPTIAAHKKDRRIRILCAAASTGQEPYSISLTLSELGAAYSGWTFDVLATDIDDSVLNRARAGTYSQFEVQRGLPVPLLLKYFTQESPSSWRINEKIRRPIRFQKFNLLDDMSRLGVFDIVFCRNVLIYFDVATKGDVLRRLSRQIAPGGYLLLGCSETVIGICNEFTAVSGTRGLYQLANDAINAARLASNAG